MPETKWLAKFFAMTVLIAGLLIWLITPQSRHPPSAVTKWRVEHLIHYNSLAEPGECEVRTRLGHLRQLDPGARDQVDGWGRPLWMHCMNGRFEVRSAGADGELDTDDDMFESAQWPWLRP